MNIFIYFIGMLIDNDTAACSLCMLVFKYLKLYGGCMVQLKQYVSKAIFWNIMSTIFKNHHQKYQKYMLPQTLMKFHFSKVNKETLSGSLLATGSLIVRLRCRRKEGASRWTHLLKSMECMFATYVYHILILWILYI